MTTQILLKLKGSFATGFDVEVDWDRQGREAKPGFGKLPANLDLWEAYQTWRSNYRSYGGITEYRIEEVESKSHVTLFSIKDEGKSVLKSFENWLTSEAFSPIVQWLKLQLELAKCQGREVRILLQTDHAEIRLLPWQSWSLVQGYTNFEIAFAPTTYTKIPQPAASDTLRILVILGCSDGLDTGNDRREWMNLPRAIVKLLEEPTREQLTQVLQQSSWDILFFAGHSQTAQMEGFIDLNPNDRLSLEELKQTLKTTIARGLKLAIFNSCDGLGLLNTFSELHIPQMIVMREPIPDRVAHKFLEYFLTEFSSGKSFYASVAQARAHLEGLQDKYPCATWLPVSYQNPAIDPLRWPSRRQLRLRLRGIIALSLIITCLVIGLRMQGLMQPLELQAYDHLMRMRSTEKPDQRLAVVSITAADVMNQPGPKDGSLSDETLQILISSLEKYNPKVIGFDIYRDFPTEKRRSLQQRLASDRIPKLIFPCSHHDSDRTGSGFAPPPEVDLKRTAFINVPIDSDNVTRRYSFKGLSSDQKSRCKSEFSMALTLTTEYIDQLNKSKGEKDLIFENLYNYLDDFSLKERAGGYQKGEGLQADSGDHLLNYRPYIKSDNFVETIRLKEILRQAVSPEKIKDKIILIGREDDSKDIWATPYERLDGRGPDPKNVIPGVYIHAQATSQLLSAILDNSPQIWWLPLNAEWIWFSGWGLASLLLMCSIQKVKGFPEIYRYVGGWICLQMTAYLVCRIAMINSLLWLPLIPTLFTITIACTFYYLIVKLSKPGDYR